MNRFNIKKLFVFFVLSFIVSFSISAQVDAEVPKGQVQIIDNFENGNFWIWASFDWVKYNGIKHSDGADLSQKWVSEGNYSMELLVAANSGKANCVWFYDGSQDLSGGKYIVADFYNPYPVTHQICFVIQTTKDWKWIQTEIYNIPQGKHTVVFYVGNMNETFNEINRINIFDNTIEGYPKDFSLFVDNIRLIK